MKKKQDKNWLEWVVLILSTALVLTAIGILLFDAINGKDTAPAIAVSLGQPQHKEHHFAIPLIAKNNGIQTAEDIRIEVISGTGNDQEKASVEFPYLPGKSTVNGWITFTKDPRPIEALKIRVLGYGTH